MIRKKVLGIGVSSATLLVQDTQADNELRVLRRINVTGWNEMDITDAQSQYTTIQNAGLPAVVHIHAVLLQNSFLNVVSSYCQGGDVGNHIEEELRKPLPERQALRWLLVVAQALRRLHKQTKLSFYGLTLEHIFLDSARGIEGIMVGLPLPRSSYFRALEERRAEGIVVQREYPPEVVEKQTYHPTLSDVWHLGLIGVKLLSTHTSIKERSTAVQHLLDDMLSVSLSKRASMDAVVATLTQLAGEVRLPPSRPLPAAAGTPPPHSAPVKSQPQQTQMQCAPNSSTTHSPGSSNEREVDDANASRDHGAAACGQARGARGVQDSWHRKALHQFEQLQRLNASPVPKRGGSRNVSPMVRRATPQNDSRRNSTGGGGSGAQQNNGSFQQFTPRGSGRAAGSPQRPIDNNTRALNEMFAEQEEQLQKRERLRQEMEWRRRRIRQEGRQAAEAHQQHLDNMKNIRDGDNRKNIKELRRQQDGEDSDVAMAPTPENEDDSSRGQQQQHWSRHQSPMLPFGQKRIVYRKNTTVPVTIMTPKGPHPYGTQGGEVAETEARNVAPTVDVSAKPLEDSTPSRRSPPKPHSPPRETPVRVGDVGKGRPLVPASRAVESAPHAAPRGGGRHHSDPSGRPSPESGTTAAVGGGTGVVSLAALEWAVDGLRSSIRGIVTDPTAYGETMMTISDFARRSEDERFSPHHNENFMRRVRSIVMDNRAFAFAAPLCAQLVALEAMNLSFRGGGAHAQRLPR